MKDACELTSYDEIVELLTNLRFVVRETRRRDRLSLSDVADRTGVAASTVHRFERGSGLSMENLMALLVWLGGSETGGNRAWATTDGDDGGDT